MQEGDNRNNGSNNSRSILMALVACYIIYLGVSILRGMFRGEGGMPFGLGVFFGIAFVAAGGAYLIYLLRQFLMSGSARKDEAAEDPAKAVIEKEGGISGAEENEAKNGPVSVKLLSCCHRFHRRISYYMRRRIRKEQMPPYLFTDKGTGTFGRIEN